LARRKCPQNEVRRGEKLMRGRHYVIDTQYKKFNGNSKATVRGNANIIYLNTSNNYTAAKEEEDRKKAIISVSIIIAFLFLFTMVVTISNHSVGR